MDTLYFLCSLVAVLVIVRWYVKNDGRARTSGLLRVKEANDADQVD